MTRKHYLTPQSRLTRIATEQGVCASSNEESTLNPPEEEEQGNIQVENYEAIDNNITFD